MASKPQATIISNGCAQAITDVGARRQSQATSNYEQVRDCPDFLERTHIDSHMNERSIENLATRIMTICEAVRQKHGFFMWSEARKEIQPLLERAING